MSIKVKTKIQIFSSEIESSFLDLKQDSVKCILCINELLNFCCSAGPGAPPSHRGEAPLPGPPPPPPTPSTRTGWTPPVLRTVLRHTTTASTGTTAATTTTTRNRTLGPVPGFRGTVGRGSAVEQEISQPGPG